MFFSAHFRKKNKKPLFFLGFFSAHFKKYRKFKKKKVFSARLGAQTPPPRREHKSRYFLRKHILAEKLLFSGDFFSAHFRKKIWKFKKKIGLFRGNGGWRGSSGNGGGVAPHFQRSPATPTKPREEPHFRPKLTPNYFLSHARGLSHQIF